MAVGEEPDTIEEVYEPYLIMEGYLKRTPQGRVATELSYQKLGLKAGGRQAAEPALGPPRKHWDHTHHQAARTGDGPEHLRLNSLLAQGLQQARPCAPSGPAP